MRIAVLAPLTVPAFRPWLDVEDGLELPAGHGGSISTIVTRDLLRQGHEVVLATLDGSLDAPRTYRGPQLVAHVLPLRRSGTGRDAFRAERRHLADALRGAAVDVAHAWWTYEYALAAQAAVRAPTLVGVHDWAPLVLRLQPDGFRTARLAMQVAVLARARHLQAPSPYLADRVARWVRRPVEVIPNCVDDDRFVPAGTAGAAREPLLVSVNDGFSRRKNVPALLRAFVQVRRAHPDLELALVGAEHGPGEAAEAWARAHGLAAGVCFLGRRPHEEVTALMRRARVLVHPALEESFGMVLIEAMAQATPVVAGLRSGAVPWVLDGGTAGRLVDVADPGALAAATAALLDDPAAASALGAAGRAHAWASFRTSAVTRRYLDRYAGLVTDGIELGRPRMRKAGRA